MEPELIGIYEEDREKQRLKNVKEYQRKFFRNLKKYKRKQRRK